MPIRILSPEVASQIAAGEVIERPASVVKELVENALDAGADQVSIRTESAGRRLIEVSDDGCGIPPKELSMSVERHATSKLSKASDLLNIGTLGFRGEALASIGSVSRMSITSRVASNEMGVTLSIDGGVPSYVQPVGAPIGTLVSVKDLFYNLPARLKFLKKDTTERRHIDSLTTRYALAYPHVRFQLTQERRIALQTSGNGDCREALASLLGPDVARQMLEVASSGEKMKVSGFISPTSVTRGSRRWITFYVNGRPVVDPALSAALTKAYHTLLMVGRYPLAVLFLELSPEAVDVNVHPTKAEVRFRQPSEVFTSVQSAVRRALLAHNPVQALNSQLRWSPPDIEVEKISGDGSDWGAFGSSSSKPMDERYGEAYDDEIPQEYPQTEMPTERVPLLRAVGQVASAYLVAEGPDGLYLIDQHAAHERVLFERLLSMGSSEITSQALLQPVSVELPPSRARLLEDQIPVLSRYGFKVEAFGPNTFLVRAIPTLLSNISPTEALLVLVEDFEEDEKPLQSKVEERIIGRVCKRAAIKAGQSLSIQEQRALIQELEACQSPRTCPHGRPTMIHLSVDLLDRQFGRKGAR
jgi:DNA mismatch repair protein MutL